MKYIADRGYKDLQLNRHVDKGEELDKIYQESKVELTDERRKLLVEVKQIFIPIEEVNESEVKDITLTDEIPEGAQVVDGLNIKPDTNEVDNQEEKQDESSNESDSQDGNKQEDNNEADNQEESQDEKEKSKANTKNKNTSKTSIKNEEK